MGGRSAGFIFVVHAANNAIRTGPGHAEQQGDSQLRAAAST